MKDIRLYLKLIFEIVLCICEEVWIWSRPMRTNLWLWWHRYTLKYWLEARKDEWWLYFHKTHWSDGENG